MVKYDYAFKKKVVEAYQNGAGGYRTLANQFYIASLSTVRNGLKQSRNLDLTSGDSYLTVALKYGLPNDTLVLAWHQKFLATGIEGLSSKQR